LGRIVGIFVILLVLGGIAAGYWYWNHQQRSVMTIGSVPALESDTTLQRRANALHDSIQTLDQALRAAQRVDSTSPVELAKLQSDLWARYTWTRARLSEAKDAKTDTARPAAKDGAGLVSALGNLAMYLWILAGVAALVVAFLVWWLFGRRSLESAIPLTEPTLTRGDRNVRMPVPGDQPRGAAPREATFSQIRAARAEAEAPARAGRRIAEPDPDMPAAPLPKTGRHAWENTTSQPATNMPSPSEPTVVQDYVVSMAKRGRTSSEIARRLRIPQDQVDLILKLRRNG